MPRKNPVTPSYRLHKPSGQAVVTLSGKHHYLGRYGTAASKTEYDQLIACWLANGRGLPPEPASQLPPTSTERVNSALATSSIAATNRTVGPSPDGGPTANEVVLAYLRHAKEYYKDAPGSGRRSSSRSDRSGNSTAANRPGPSTYSPSSPSATR